MVDDANANHALRAQAEFLYGPDDYSLQHGGLPQYWTTEDEVWQDVLSKEEVNYICGQYLDDTGCK